MFHYLYFKQLVSEKPSEIAGINFSKLVKYVCKWQYFVYVYFMCRCVMGVSLVFDLLRSVTFELEWVACICRHAK